MPPEQSKSIIYQARQAGMTGEADGFSSLFYSDGVFMVPGQQWNGQEAIRQSLIEFARTHTEISIEIHRILIDHHRAVVEWFWQDREKEQANAHKRTIRTAFADLFEIVIHFKDGLIHRWREYIDLESSKK